MNHQKMHVSLYVKDLDNTTKFYDLFFDQAADKVKPGYARYTLNEPGLVISFVENDERVQPGFGHLGFRVDEPQLLEQIHQRVKASGLGTKEEIGTNCCYAEQDKFWVSDPDGHQWEIYYFHKDVEFNDIRYASESEMNCCMPPSNKKQKVNLRDLNQEVCTPGSNCC